MVDDATYKRNSKLLMNRETKEIITPIGKKKVVLKAWLTGREKRHLRNVLLQDVKFSVEKGDTKTEGINTAEAIQRAEDEAIKTIVVSIEEKTDKILDTILDMRDKDSDFVITEVNKIGRDEGFQKPK